MITSEKRQKMENLIYKCFSALDDSGENTKKYQSMFKSMSDTEFDNYFKALFKDDDAYLILTVVDYEHSLTVEEIYSAAKVLKIPLFEDVYMPFVSMDNDNVVVTQKPVPVGYIHVKRPQQTVMKKNGMSTTISKRSAITNQVTGSDKNGRESDLENSMLAVYGLDKTLAEINGPRADDPVMKSEMLQQIYTRGYCNYDELTNDISNKTTLNTVDTYLKGMVLDSDLVTTGLMLNSTLRKEL